MRKYIKRFFRSLSILLNVLLGGKSNQTFSARNYDRKKRNKINMVWLIDFLAYHIFGDVDHCLTSWVYWVIISNELKELEKTI